jgi:hypothetical protein
MLDHDPESERLTIRRTLSAEPTIVRGLLHELAQTGEWTGLSDPGDHPVEIHVEDGGAGSAVIEVSQQASPEQHDQMGAALTHAVDELERRLVQRTTDAS